MIITKILSFHLNVLQGPEGTLQRKIQSNFIEITLRHGCSPVNLLHFFRTPFHKNISGGLLLQGKNKSKLAKISSNHFLSANRKL